MTPLLRSGTWALAAVAVAEFTDWAARRGTAIPKTGDGAIVVLGFPGTNAVGRAVQRWRVQMAVSAHRRLGTTHVIFSGGVPRSVESESSQMAAYARGLGLDEREIVLEEASVSTWENTLFAASLVRDERFVVLVSDGVHARRARAYWRCQHPDTSVEVFVDPAFRLLDHVWLKFPATVANSVRSVKDRHAKLTR